MAQITMATTVRRGSAALAVAAALAGCSGGNDDGPRGACLDAMSAAADVPMTEDIGPYLTETLNTCETSEAWLEALREHPGAMGLTERAEIGQLDLEIACNENADTPVCIDAGFGPG